MRLRLLKIMKRINRYGKMSTNWKRHLKKIGKWQVAETNKADTFDPRFGETSCDVSSAQYSPPPNATIDSYNAVEIAGGGKKR